MRTPEGKVKDKVIALLKKYNTYYFMPVQTGYGAQTLDILGCCNGRFFSIETKAPGKKPTMKQILTIRNMLTANAKVFVIDGKAHQLERLETWLIQTALLEPQRTTG